MPGKMYLNFMIDKNFVVPRQEKGTASGAEEQLKYDTHREALSYYEIFKQRFLHVNSWRKFTGKTGIRFELAGVDGELVENEDAQEGLLIRIDQGPGVKSGNRFDWVRIELITDEYDPMKDESAFSMRVRSIPEPGFIVSESSRLPNAEFTNTFTLKRIGTEIIASVHGNNDTYVVEPTGFFSKLRNIILGVFSSSSSSNSNWKIFLKGLLGKK
jgi:hypothetical protein